MIIGLTGPIGAGKDTTADILQQIDPELHRISFIGACKDMIAGFFGWSRQALDGNSPEDREWRETVDEKWSEYLQIPNLTPRYVTRHLASEGICKGFSDRMWVAYVEDYYNRHGKPKMVITDVRFPNEFEFVRSNGGTIIEITNRRIKIRNEHISDAYTSDRSLIRPGDLNIKNDTCLQDLYEKTKIAYGQVIGSESLRKHYGTINKN